VAHNWERFRKSTQEEIDAVVSVLKSGHLSIAQGSGMPQAEGLEREFAEWVGAKHCLAVNSGTAALHCAVAGVGVEPGDEVIVPAFTFIASAMVVLHQNAIPIFVDVDPRTYLIDPKKIEEKITERTKAIMPVHIYGLPCDMQEINQIAKRHGLKVIEDSAQAYGALYNGKKTGAGFAMTTTKHIMTGEGGVFTTSDEAIYERAAMLRLFGERGDMNAPDRAYLSESIGWNYKLAEVCSALARVKLRHIDDYVGTIQRNAARLTEGLEGIDGLVTPVVPPGRTHSYYLYPVQVDPMALNLDTKPSKLRNAVLGALTAENVPVFRWQKVPVPSQPLFQNKLAYGRGCPWSCRGADDVGYRTEDYPNTVAILDNSFVLWGLVPPNGFELMDRYVAAFEKVFQHIDRVIDIYGKE
jgi:dTDP-4-amino-4,6-dideoxygalactose transaminase